MKLHTSYEERKKEGRNVERKISWGEGVTEGVPFTKNMLHPRYWGTWLGFIVLFLIVNLLPYKLTMALGRLLGRTMQRILKPRRYVVSTNLKLAFPQMSQEERDQLQKRIFENAGMAIFETGIAWFWPDWRIKRMLIIDDKELALAKELALIN